MAVVAPFPQIRLKAERCCDFVYCNDDWDHPKVRAVRDWRAEEIHVFLANTGI